MNSPRRSARTASPDATRDVSDDERLSAYGEEGWTFAVTLTDVSLDVMAILCGIPLVDLSIEHEPHIIRGEN